MHKGNDIRSTCSKPDKIEKYIIDNIIYNIPPENECMCSFSREWWQRATSLENERVCLFSREVVLAKNNCPRKQTFALVFEGESKEQQGRRVVVIKSN